MERRGFLEFVGGIGFGGLLGYYAGATELLGIQSDSQNPTKKPAVTTPTEEPPSNTPTEKPAVTTPTDIDLPPLVARYTFEGSGSTIKDVTGNGHDGKIHNSSRESGYDGQSLQFGKQEYASFGDADELNPRDGSIAIEYRFKSTSNDKKNELVTKRGGNNIFLRTLLRGGRVMFLLKDTLSPYTPVSAVRTEKTYNDGEWHHVIAFRDTDNGQLRLWVDGTEHTGADEEGDVNPSGPWFAGGQPQYPNPRYTEGMIDNLRIYK